MKPAFPLLNDDSTPDEVQAALVALPPRLVKRVAKAIGVKQQRKVETIAGIMTEDICTVITVYNLTVQLREERVKKAQAIFNTLIALVSMFGYSKVSEKLLTLKNIKK